MPSPGFFSRISQAFGQHDSQMQSNVPRLVRANAMSYGPVMGEHGQAQTIGSTGMRLGPQDIAVSPNLSDRFGIGRWVQATDDQGNIIGTYRVADTSWYSPGHPTKNTVEFRDAKRSGNVFLSPLSDASDLSDAPMVHVDAPSGLDVPPAASYPSIAGPASGNLTAYDPDWAQNAAGAVPGGGPGGPTAGNWAINAARPTAPYGYGPNYVDPAEANAYIPGLVAWNSGAWQANPAAGEGGVAEQMGRTGFAAAHNIGALAARFGMAGRSGGGRMPVGFQ